MLVSVQAAVVISGGSGAWNSPAHDAYENAKSSREHNDALCTTGRGCAALGGGAYGAEAFPVGTGAASFVGAHSVEGMGKRVEDKNLGEVRRRIYLRAPAALDDHISRTKAWLRGVAR